MFWLIPTLAGSNRHPGDLDEGQRAIVNQRPFLVTVGFVLVLALAVTPEVFLRPMFLVGVGITIISRVPSSIESLRHRAKTLNWLIPLMQFAAIGALRIGGDDLLLGLSLIAVFPVIWISWFEDRKRWVHAINFGATLVIVWLPIFASGTPLSVSTLAAPLLVPVILCVIGIFASSVSRSISAQRRELLAKDRELRAAADESRLHARLLDTVIETVPTGVVVVDADGNDVMMNSHQRSLHRLGTPSDTADPREDELLLFAADKTTPVPASERPVRRAIDGHAVSNQLIWLGDHQPRALSVSASRMQTVHGGSGGSVVVFNDVTALMQALEAKDEFLHSVSHELRTPLTSILGYVDLALEESEGLDEPGDLIANLQVVERNASRLLRLVSDLLATASGPILHPLASDLASVVRSSLASAKPQAAAAGVALVDSAVSGTLGFFDPDRMHQVVDNLIANAIKYSPAGASVTATCRTDGETLELCVVDTGRGMREEDRLRVFEHFYRTSDVRESAIPGLGLGLTITQGIVQAHGGTISVSSAPDEGTAVTVRIPSAQAGEA